MKNLLFCMIIITNWKYFLQAIVDSPGACHYASVWQRSSVRKAMISKEIKICSNYHLLGDGGYPLELFLMVPYQDNGFLTPMQSKYNAILSSTRVVEEQAFGV
uniref:DDE Tnp4 domain-containing protein n=1 Tax=Bactrocera latifrons TaxID=174628 RepID=A0A0K8WD20_BACLA